MNLQPTICGERVTIRPIRITDTTMEADFIRGLSPTTKYFRFLGGVNELSPAQVARLCDVDGKHSMAFVATVSHDDHEIQIGVSRYAPNSTADVREMAVTITDEWQHKGLGTLLAQQLIQSAKSNGVRQLYSIDLATNTAMAALAKELGMSSCADPSNPGQVIYSLTL